MSETAMLLDVLHCRHILLMFHPGPLLTPKGDPASKLGLSTVHIQAVEVVSRLILDNIATSMSIGMCVAMWGRNDVSIGVHHTSAVGLECLLWWGYVLKGGGGGRVGKEIDEGVEEGAVGPSRQSGLAPERAVELRRLQPSS